MAGSSNITGQESIIFADNASFDGTERGGAMTTNGQLWIGSTVAPHVRLSSLTAGTGITISNGNGSITISSPSASSAVQSVSGTLNRITSTGGQNPIIDIDSGYIGQSSITTLGTVSTGTWNASTVDVSHGGSGKTTFTAYSVLCAGTTATGSFQNVSGLGNSGDILTSNGASSLPSWQPAPATGVTSVSGTLNRITSTGGSTPVINIDSAYVGQTSITTIGTVATGTWNATAIDVAHGGTGNTTFTAYSVICAGTTSTGIFQNVSGLGTSGQVLTSNGAGALPSWQAAAGGGVTSVSGTSNQINSTGGTTPVLSLSSTITTPGSLVTTTTLTSTTLFTASAGQVVARNAQSGDYSVQTTDYIVAITSTAAARTVTLPSSPSTGQVFIIKDESGAASINNISVVVSGGTNIDGAATQKIYTNYGSMTVYHSGSGVYFIV